MFDPLDFLDIARSLSTSVPSEAGLRTAVGRAYYAVFLSARNRFGVRRRQKVHGEVIALLKRKDRAAGDQLDKLQELRVIADYDLTNADPLRRDWKRNWENARDLAQYVLQRLHRV